MIDKQLTNDIIEWVNQDHFDDTDEIIAGATMLLKLNRNQALYNSIIRNPQKYVAKIEYELRKFLPMRLKDMTLDDVKRLDAEITPVIKEAIEAESEDDGQEEEPDGDLPAHTGKRTDHDSLPDDIKAIWTANAERWRKIKECYNTLLTLTEPCDRCENLLAMKEAWYKYKSEFERYDNYTVDDNAENGSADPAELAKEFTNARAYISKNVEKVIELRNAAKADDAEAMKRYDAALKKLYRRTDVLLAGKQVIGDELMGKIRDAGVVIPDTPTEEEDNGQGNAD